MQDAHGGSKCPSLVEAKACHVQDCPIHCKVSGFTEWSTCNAECSGGTMTRTRSLLQAPMFNGIRCPHLTDIKRCNTHTCPVHCEVSGWSDFSACNAKCGGGKSVKSRSIIVNMQYNGNKCPDLTFSKACNTQLCPIHCQVSEWSAWSACNAECGGGFKTQTRTILVEAQYNGDSCPALSKTDPCNTQTCPIHCKVSSWGAWSACSKSCSNGEQKRTRSVILDAQFNGKECPEVTESRACNTAACPTSKPTSQPTSAPTKAPTACPVDLPIDSRVGWSFGAVISSDLKYPACARLSLIHI